MGFEAILKEKDLISNIVKYIFKRYAISDLEYEFVLSDIYFELYSKKYLDKFNPNISPIKNYLYRFIRNSIVTKLNKKNKYNKMFTSVYDGLFGVSKFPHNSKLFLYFEEHIREILSGINYKSIVVISNKTGLVRIIPKKFFDIYSTNSNFTIREISCLYVYDKLIEGYLQKDVAELLYVSPTWVSSKVKIIRNILNEVVEKYGYFF